MLLGTCRNTYARNLENYFFLFIERFPGFVPAFPHIAFEIKWFTCFCTVISLNPLKWFNKLPFASKNLKKPQYFRKQALYICPSEKVWEKPGEGIRNSKAVSACQLSFSFFCLVFKSKSWQISDFSCTFFMPVHCRLFCKPQLCQGRTALPFSWELSRWVSLLEPALLMPVVFCC